jgi:predicted CopG family antitoxin
MATKTISVDLEAYERLRRAKTSERESFSRVIKRAVWEPKHGTTAQLLAFVRSPDASHGLSKEALDELDRIQRCDAAAPDRWTEDES